MSLDPAPTEARIRAMHAERTGTPVSELNGVALGPDSPMRGQRDRKGGYASKRSTAALEHDIQVAFFKKVEDPDNQRRWPELATVHAIPNFFGASAATRAQGGRAKAEGRKPGVPDVHCPVARGGFFSLYIEFKKPGGTTSTEQAHWMATLAREGHKVALHTDEEAAWAELLAYLALPRTAVQTADAR